MFRRFTSVVARRPPFAFLLIALYIAIAVLYFSSLEGGFDFRNDVVGADFINLWTAGKAVVADRVPELFDVSTYQAFQRALFDRPLQDRNWSYPPYMLFVAAPLAAFSYVWALVAWMVLTLSAYLVATRRFALVLAPATFVNALVGQTGFLIGALFLGGIAQLQRRPVVAGILLGLVALKPHLGILVPVALVAAGAWRTFASGAVTFAALCGLSLLVFGWEVWSVYLTATAAFQVGVVLESDATQLFKLMMPSAFMAGRLLGLDTIHAYWLQVPFTLFAIRAVWSTFRDPHRDALHAAGVLALATPVALPYFFIYDLTLVAPAALLAIEARRRPVGLSMETIWPLAWWLPILVVPSNMLSLPIGPLVLTAALALMLAQRPVHSRGNRPTVD